MSRDCRTPSAPDLYGPVSSLLCCAQASGNLDRINTYLHGEVVALGMVGAMGWIASQQGRWQEAKQQRQTTVLAKDGLPLRWPPLDPAAVMACMGSDKKVRNGCLRFVVPRALGQVEIRDDISTDLVGQALEALQ